MKNTEPAFSGYEDEPVSRDGALEALENLISKIKKITDGAVLLDPDIQRIRQALEQSLDGGWKPIESAPKDGTRLLVRDKWGEIIHAYWHKHEIIEGWCHVNDEEAYSNPYFMVDYMIPQPPKSKE